MPHQLLPNRAWPAISRGKAGSVRLLLCACLILVLSYFWSTSTSAEPTDTDKGPRLGQDLQEAGRVLGASFSRLGRNLRESFASAGPQPTLDVVPRPRPTYHEIAGSQQLQANAPQEVAIAAEIAETAASAATPLSVIGAYDAMVRQAATIPERTVRHRAMQAATDYLVNVSPNPVQQNTVGVLNTVLGLDALFDTGWSAELIDAPRIAQSFRQSDETTAFDGAKEALRALQSAGQPQQTGFRGEPLQNGLNPKLEDLSTYERLKRQALEETDPVARDGAIWMAQQFLDGIAGKRLSETDATELDALLGLTSTTSPHRALPRT